MLLCECPDVSRTVFDEYHLWWRRVKAQVGAKISFHVIYKGIPDMSLTVAIFHGQITLFLLWSDKRLPHQNSRGHFPHKRRNRVLITWMDRG
jgi:hypothetical protein